ncbi:MAG: cofactor-independent phosphoglycerate mutase [Thermodesulfobacteriota bacterium]
MSSGSSTKYVILVPDGMADLPIPELEQRTPLEAAHTPWMDKVASRGRTGMTRTVPQGMDPGSDVANLSIMGYDPREVYSGRAPFEAAAMGIRLGDDDVAFRVNLVTLDRNYTFMSDHSADHITSEEARELVAAVAPMVESLGLSVYPGVSYRNILVWANGPVHCVTHPPHDFPGRPLDAKLPAGQGSDTLLRMIVESWRILEHHPVNEARVRQGLSAANSLWPWGQGKTPRMTPLQERFGITGAVVSAVDLLRGIGWYAGLEILKVPGATGYLDTNYQGKVEAALSALKAKDLVLVHVEAPDETSHSGKVDLKTQAIEDFDEKIVGPMLKGLEQFPQWRMLLMPDHPTPVSGRVHTGDPVPFVVLDSDQWVDSSPSNGPGFSEKAAQVSGWIEERADHLIEVLLER